MTPHTKKKKPLPKDLVKQKLRERKKLSKLLQKEKRARLLVKNLSFKVTEEKLKEFFGKYGEISSVELLKKPDGKLVGCGFIQFKLVQKAAKARHHINGKEFLGRILEVEFAKPKNKYKKEIQNLNTAVKSTDESTVPKVEIEEINSSENDENEDGNDDEHGEETNSGKDNENTSSDSEDNQKNNPHYSHDVSEGKTIFIKNIPFNATQDDLKQCMLQFGRIFYSLICFDKLTEHSKGTGFVKFVNQEDAEKALNAGTELKLLGNILDCHPALDRKEIQNKMKDKVALKAQPKDSRNLYLVKEGVVPPGSNSADGVSPADMMKRSQIEKYKTQMLRNLNMFVSKDRLVVHNLPASWDDKKLRNLFQKYGGQEAVIRESRIMRDRKNLDDKGQGLSKQYGFVTFTRHENALTALRNLNNNPNIFSSNKRPIIVFSIESRAAILAKQKRLEKSKLQLQANNESKAKKLNKFSKFKIFHEKRKSAKKPKPLKENEIAEFSGIMINKSSS